MTPNRAFWLGVGLVVVGFLLSPWKFVGAVCLGAAWIWYAFDLVNAEEEPDVAEPPPTPYRR